MIRFACPACTKDLKAPAAAAGRKSRCPSCGEPLTVPAQRAETVSEVAAASRAEPLATGIEDLHKDVPHQANGHSATGVNGRSSPDGPRESTPPPLPAEKWFYARHGQQVGPVSLQVLQGLWASGNLAPADLVWQQGMADWQPAAAVLRGELLEAVSDQAALAGAPPLARNRLAFVSVLLTVPGRLLQARRVPLVLTAAAGCISVLLLVCLLGRFSGRDNRQIRDAINGWLKVQRAGATNVEKQTHWFGREEEFATAQAWAIQDVTFLNPKENEHGGDRKLDNMAQARVRVTRLTNGGRRLTQDWDFHLGKAQGVWGVGWVEETKARRWRAALAALTQREGWRLETLSLRFEEDSEDKTGAVIKAAHRDLPGVHLWVSAVSSPSYLVRIRVEDDKFKTLAQFDDSGGELRDENFSPVKAVQGQRRVWMEKGRELVRLHHEAMDTAFR